MANVLNDQALNTLFREARSYTKWQDKPVSNTLLMALYDLVRLGPTAVNSCPMRILFLTSTQSKEKLKPFLHANNVEKSMKAPVVAVLGYDLEFAKTLDKLFPFNPAVQEVFARPEHALPTAFRNASMQGGYFILAARALGLDCGPISGYDEKGVDEAFFAGTAIKSNFLCNLGYGDPAGTHPRAARPDFDEACKIL